MIIFGQFVAQIYINSIILSDINDFVQLIGLQIIIQCPQGVCIFADLLNQVIETGIAAEFPRLIKLS